jgi:thymidylate synthase (methanogen type)
MINKIIIGKDNGKEIFKIEDKQLIDNLHFFNSADVLVGNTMSNIALAFIYNWKSDEAPKQIKEIFVKMSNYCYLTGYWRTTNGAKYVFSNILINPNVNKLIVCVFDDKDNGHHLVDALRCFWKNGIKDDGTIIGSIAANPRFQGINKEALDRVRKQVDLVIISKATGEKIEETLNACIQEPENKTKVDGVEVFPAYELYDCGARFEEPFYVEFGNISIEKIEDIPESEVLSTLGLSIKAKNLDDALKRIVKEVFEKGSVLKDQRKITIREERSLNVVITSPLEKIPESYSIDYLEKYKNEFMNGVNNNTEFAYTYHDRIFRRWGSQPEKVIALLKKSPNTRRALISLWDPESDLDSETPPCLDFLWFCVRGGKLECHIVYRSHHIATVDQKGNIVPGEGAFVPNLYAIHHLHKMIAEKSGNDIGPMILIDFSGHLYVCD